MVSKLVLNKIWGMVNDMKTDFPHMTHVQIFEKYFGDLEVTDEEFTEIAEWLEEED